MVDSESPFPEISKVDQEKDNASDYQSPRKLAGHPLPAFGPSEETVT